MNIRKIRFRRGALAAAVLTALTAAGAVIAQSTAPTAAQRQELDAARADLQRAAARMAELSRAYGGDESGMPVAQMRRGPVIGVLLGPDAQAGVRIAGVTPQSPAAGAGLLAGDRLLAVDGRAIDGSDGDARLASARALLGKLDPARPVALRFARDGRERSASVTPRIDQRVFVWNDKDGTLSKLTGDVDVHVRDDGATEFRSRGAEVQRIPGVAPEIRREIVRLGSPADCAGGDCRAPMLMEAFRWNGLNLASLDADLGRYFGTDRGVLVISSGELDGLRAGDVIQRVDGKPVATPREAMAALRAQPADAHVRVDYLRERKSATAQVKVPEAMPLRMPLPPAPPAPPSAPGAPALAPPAPLPPLGAMPPAPPLAPMAPMPDGATQRRKVVMVDKDGKTRTWEGDTNEPMPAWAKQAGSDGNRRVEKRVVIRDANGNTRVLEGDDLPALPMPPAAPLAPMSPTPAGTIQRRKVVMVDKDGKTRTWEGAAGEPMPAWAKEASPDAKRRVEKRVVIRDADGNTRVLEGDDVAEAPKPPAPPAPPSKPAPPPPPPPLND